MAQPLQVNAQDGDLSLSGRVLPGVAEGLVLAHGP